MYLITGTLIYLIIDTGTHVKDLPPTINQDGQESIADQSIPNKETPLEEAEKKDEDDMVDKLDFLYNICKHYCNAVKKIKKLNYEHRRNISDTYGKCHTEGENQSFRFFQCLKALSVDPTFLNTCQLVVDEIYRIEIDHHHCGNNEKALLCIKQHLRFDIVLVGFAFK